MATGSTVRLADYQPYPFKVVTVHLDVDVQEQVVQITSTMAVEPRVASSPSTSMQLRGQGLDLISISIDGQPLDAERFHLDEQGLEVHHPPARAFELTTVCRLDP